jgi:hypothetical protein
MALTIPSSMVLLTSEILLHMKHLKQQSEVEDDRRRADQGGTVPHRMEAAGAS